MLNLRARATEAEQADGAALCLEIVAGPRAGARVPVEAGRTLRIGHAFDDDVVIRHPSVRGVRALLSCDADGLRLRVEAGTVMVLGVPVEVGGAARLPRWTPFAIGESILAVGPERGRGWHECRRLARQLVADRDDASPTKTAAGERDPAMSAPESSALARMWHARWWRVPALLVMTAVVALVAVLASPAPPGVRPAADLHATQLLRAALLDEGLSHLKIASAASGGMVLQGLVDRETDRARLAERLTREGLSVRLDLGTGEQLARQVGDVMRLNGIAAQVRHVGRGVVEMRFVDPGAPQRELIESAVRRDVPGLAGLVLEVSPAPEPAERAPSRPTNVGKRVVNVVYGPRGYVVTADGSRYFSGAFLPSGHRIARISADEVELERDGKTSRLAL
jgi:type III secretion system YscD/HrpQ family protein